MRLQALVRGRLVRKQAAVTLRCMQALVRVQARVRARRVRMSLEGQAVQNMLNERRTKAELYKEAEVPSHEFFTQKLHTIFKMLLVFFTDQNWRFISKRNFCYMNLHQGKTPIINNYGRLPKKHARNYLDLT